MSSSSSPSIWEQRFPTFVGGSPNLAVARPGSSTLQSAGRSRVATGSGPQTFPLRPGQKSTVGAAESKVLSPAEALRAASDAQRGPLDYSSGSIMPGVATPQPSRKADPPRPAIVPPLGGLRPHSPGASNHHHVVGPEGVNEYDKFLNAIDRIQGRMQHMPLHRRWHLISTWLEKFVYNETCERLVNGAAVLFSEVSKTAKLSQKPELNGMRTAISFMFLEQILFVIGSSYPELTDLTELVRDEMMHAVYISPETTIDLRSSFTVIDDPTDPEEQQKLISRFYKKTYYQKIRELSIKMNQKQTALEAAERTKDKQMRILNRVVNYWQGYTKRTIFRCWRGYIRGRKVKRELVQKHDELANKLTTVREQFGGQTTNVTRSLEQMTSKCEALTAEVEQQRLYMKAMSTANDDLTTQLKEVHKTFHEDSRVRAMTREIAELRQRNAELRAALAGGDEALEQLLSRRDSAIMAKDVPDDMSFVVHTEDSVFAGSQVRQRQPESVDDLRKQLALAHDRIRALEQDGAKRTASS